MMKFEEAVKKWKPRAIKQESDLWELGEDAFNLEPKYGKQTIKKFAQASKWPHSIVKHCEATWKAWGQVKKVGRPTFWIASTLNPLYKPSISLKKKDEEKYLLACDEAQQQRAALIEQRPTLTHEEARDIVRTWKAQEKKPNFTMITLVKRIIKQTDKFLERGSNLETMFNTIIKNIDELENEDRDSLLECLDKLNNRMDKLRTRLSPKTKSSEANVVKIRRIANESE